MAVQKASAVKKNRLTKDILKKKTKRTREVELVIDGEVFTWELEAIGSKELDAIQSRCVPTKEQRAKGMSLNGEKFAPLLVAACSKDPELTEDEALEMWASDEWAMGELSSLFAAASDICTNGFDLPPTESV